MWVNVLTPPGAKNRAKKRTFDFGAPCTKITTRRLAVFSSCVFPSQFRVDGEKKDSTECRKHVIKTRKPRVGSVDFSIFFHKMSICKKFRAVTPTFEEAKMCARVDLIKWVTREPLADNFIAGCRGR